MIYITVALLAISFGSGYIDGLKELDTLNQDVEMSDKLMYALFFLAATILLFFALYKVTTAITQDLVFKVSWNHTNIEQSQFSCDLNVFALYLIRLGCFALSLATLGLFTPFAHMIIARRRIESLTLTPAHDFNLAQAELDNDTTRSAEVAEMMDFDISW